MGVYKVIFDNGDSLITKLNGNIEDARRYYLGNTFNLGIVNDDMHKCVSVEEIEEA